MVYLLAQLTDNARGESGETWGMAAMHDETQVRWPAAMLAATIAGFLCLAVWNSIIARPAGGYPIRIALPEAGAAAGGGALMPGVSAEEAAQEGEPDAETLLAIAPEETGSPGPAAAAALPGFTQDLTDSRARYDVANSGGSPLETVKPVRFNGAEAGSASIRISEESAFSIEGSGLARLLERAGHRDLAEQIRGTRGTGGYIGFEEIRRQGIDLRYDARSDSIVISI